jgi:hypothetical protein
MYELKKIVKLVTGTFVGTGPSSHKKRIYQAAVSQRLRNTGLDHLGIIIQFPAGARDFALLDNIQTGSGTHTAEYRGFFVRV